MQNLSSPYIALPVREKLVKIRPVVYEKSLLRGRPLKIKKKNIAKYITRQAGMPDGLKKHIGPTNKQETTAANYSVSVTDQNSSNYHSLQLRSRSCQNDHEIKLLLCCVIVFFSEKLTKNVSRALPSRPKRIRRHAVFFINVFHSAASVAIAV